VCKEEDKPDVAMQRVADVEELEGFILERQVFGTTMIHLHPPPPVHGRGAGDVRG
jgi:hypothetical protein